MTTPPSEVERLVVALGQQQGEFMRQMFQQQAEATQAQIEALTRIVNRSEQRPREQVLVDARGVGKPETLSSRVASDPGTFKVWRLKFDNWVVAAIPGAGLVLDKLAGSFTDELSPEDYVALCSEHPVVPMLSAQLKATLVSLCTDEPLSVVVHAPRGEASGLEAYRRLSQRYDPSGPRSAKSHLARLMATKAVPNHELKISVEKLERQFVEYDTRAAAPLGEEIRCVLIENLVSEPLKSHLAMNSERLVTYQALRTEIMRFADRVLTEKPNARGAAPMDVDSLESKGKKGKGKGKKGKDGQRSASAPRQKFDGQCYVCGKTGHRAAECWHGEKGGKGSDKKDSSRGDSKGKKGGSKGKKGKKGHASSLEDAAEDYVSGAKAVLDTVDWTVGSLFTLRGESPHEGRGDGRNASESAASAPREERRHHGREGRRSDRRPRSW